LGADVHAIVTTIDLIEQHKLLVGGAWLMPVNAHNAWRTLRTHQREPRRAHAFVESEVRGKIVLEGFEYRNSTMSDPSIQPRLVRRFRR
jgi:hypothetical protein